MKHVQANNNTVRLDGIDLPVEGDVRPNNLARLMGKVTFGDYSQDSDPLQSVAIWSSFTGGIGNETLKEGVDDETYWTGTLETRYPGMVTLPALTHTFPAPSGDVSRAYPLEDYPARAPSLWCAFSTTLARWNDTTRVFTSIGTLAAEPTNKAVEYNNLLWIPIGLGGYARVNHLGTITPYTDLDIIAFVVWDNKIVALTYGGVLRIKYLATAWEVAYPNLALPSGHVPRNLVVFMDQRQDPTIHIITNRDVWAYDRGLARLVRTHLQFPRHPDQGLASTVSRGESMSVSVGLGIHGYNGGIITSMGPDGRHGLPADLRGRVVDLEPEYNGLIAVIEGAQAVVSEGQEFYHVRRQYQDDMTGFATVNGHCEINTGDVFSDGTPTGEISLFYQSDTDPGWHLMGKMDRIGRAIFPFNLIETEGDATFSAGLLTRRIRFRLDFASDNPKYSPVMRSFLVKFIKIPLSTITWTFEVDLKKVSFMGMGVNDIANHLDDLAHSTELCEFIHRDRHYRVRVAQVSGSEKTGVDPRSVKQLSIVEMVLPANELREPPSGP